MTDRPKAVAVEGGYVGQGWYVDIQGQPADRRSPGVSESVAIHAADLINTGAYDNVSDAIQFATSALESR